MSHSESRIKRYLGARVNPSLHSALHRYTAQTGRSVSEIVGDAVDEYLTAHPIRCVECGHLDSQHADGLMGARAGDDWLCHTDDHTCYVGWPQEGGVRSYLDTLLRMEPTKRTRGAIQRVLAEDATKVPALQCPECDGTGRCHTHTEPECMVCAGDGECPYCAGTGIDSFH